MNKISNSLILSGLLVLVSINSIGQNLTFQRGEFWFHEIFSFRKKNAIFQTDVAFRSDDKFSNFNRTHIRIGGGYRINDNWNVVGLLGYFYNNGKINDIHDARINFDANYSVNIANSRVRFQYRFRQEYRQLFSDGKIWGSLRMRNRFGIMVPINHAAIQKNTWYYVFEDELFFELLEWNKNFLNRNRVSNTIGFALTPEFRFEINYTWEMDVFLEDNLLFSNHILWVRFRQSLFLPRQRKKRDDNKKVKQ
jgi:hypothetical protein